MPFVRISLKKSVSPETQRDIANAVQAALIGAIGVPEQDRFQIIETLPDGIIYDPTYLGVARDDGIVMIEIHLSIGRSVVQKQALYRAIADNLAKLLIRRENVFIHLVEMTRENWSFGNGIAQYVESPPPHLAGLQ
ncbi:tautomerase family protein [Methylovirgula sp. 4M-Z18]|uniref:tautomerase family protein n=1 Tax=Methylovirgula sp. 4M-Z18 TaxID=2293567 RepID=UPI000E2E7805|nr:tautomerase family protein [Methylovirgula sp. 4M-Z18]RFB75544.1 tautomerase family protein [Methylovirgula sp. 4M-Z18]